MSRITGPRNSAPSTTVRNNNTPTSQPKADTTPSPARQSPARSTHTFEVNRQKSFFRDQLSISSKTTNGPLSSSQSQTFINGRLRQSSSLSSNTNGNLSTSTQIDRAFRRNGTMSSERITQNMTTTYGPHSSISSTNIQDGRYSSSALQYSNNTGASSRVTTRTTESGPLITRSGNGLQYKGGQYKNSGPYASWRFSGGKFDRTSQVDYSNRSRVQTSTTRTHDFRANSRLTGDAETQRLADRQASAQRTQSRQRMMDIAGDLGLKTTVLGGGKPTTTTLFGNDPVQNVSADGRTKTETLLGPRVSTTQYGEVAVGADGITARGNADIRAGLYAQGSVEHTSDVGTFKGAAGAKLEAYAEANGTAALNTNGLELRGGARVGVEASAEVSGSYKTPPVTIGGREFTAGVSATGRVAAEATAEATGRVQFTRNPPTAVIEGQAGASAVVKAEGSVQADAGPFSIKASGYASAGAEAQANGSIGYDDGKVTLSFGAGAALGVGAGGRVQVQVDVAQIGQAAAGLAREGAEAAGRAMDVTGDNKFDMRDVNAIGTAAAETVANGLESAADTARDIGNNIADGARNVGNTIAAGAEAVGDGISSALSTGADNVREFFSGW